MDETFTNSPPPPLGPEAALDLTRAILSRTSGSPCQRLQTLACEYVDGELKNGQEGLVQAHLDHCPACSALVNTLKDLKTLLPTLAQVDPGPGFAPRIIRATSRAPRRSVGFDRQALWSKLLHRPRIAFETAYLGAAAGMIGLYIPVPALPPFRSVPSLVRPLSPQHLGQPLKAPVQRVLGSLLQAEQRTAATLKSALLPDAASAFRASPGASRWQVLSLMVRSWLKSAMGVFNSDHKVDRKSSKQANH